jgi:hypothetical protein
MARHRNGETVNDRETERLVGALWTNGDYASAIRLSVVAGIRRTDPLLSNPTRLVRISRAADAAGLPVGDYAAIRDVLMPAHIGQESTGNPNAISPNGAAGLTQVMPETAPEIARDLGNRNFPFDADRASI